MDDGIVISIIVPIFNAEKYINRMVKSVLCQMTEELELILVDDGSTDDSPAMCDEYARQNSRVRVIHKENGGSSAARNTGILAAQGEYISFIDADDFVDNATYESLLEVIRTHHPDCIDFGWKYIDTSGEVTYNIHRLPKEELLSVETINEVILPPLLNLCKNEDNFIYNFAWNKVYRRDKILMHGTLFNEGRRTWEDRVFILNYLRFCDNYYSINSHFYNYVGVPNSKSCRYDVTRLNIIIENYRLYKRWYGDKYDFDTDYANNYWCDAIESMIIQSLQQTENQAIIQKAVKDALQEKEVICWFSRRTPKDDFEKKMCLLVADGEVEKALIAWKNRASAITRKQNVQRKKYGLKQIIRRVIGR